MPVFQDLLRQVVNYPIIIPAGACPDGRSGRISRIVMQLLIVVITQLYKHYAKESLNIMLPDCPRNRYC